MNRACLKALPIFGQLGNLLTSFDFAGFPRVNWSLTRRSYDNFFNSFLKMSKKNLELPRAGSVLVCGHKIQGVFKEYSSTKNRVFKGNSKQVYFVLKYVLNFAICHTNLK